MIPFSLLSFQVFCSRCSANSVPLPQYGHVKPVRVCNHCFVFQVTHFTVQEEWAPDSPKWSQLAYQDELYQLVLFFSKSRWSFHCCPTGSDVERNFLSYSVTTRQCELEGSSGIKMLTGLTLNFLALAWRLCAIQVRMYRLFPSFLIPSPH